MRRALLTPVVLGSVALGSVAGVVTLSAATAAPASAEPVTEPAASPVAGAWTVHGHGWGHGHGLSQWGAQARAEAGQSAAQILAFYYPGTDSTTTPPTDVRVGLTSQASSVLRVRAVGAAALGVSDTTDVVGLGETLVLTRSGTAVVGTDTDAAGTTQWSHTWTTAPVVSGGGAFALVGASGAGVVYEGRLTVPMGTGALLPVDVLGLEAYVRGVVPNESPASWLPAALQAQAVAARSYALSTMDLTSSYDVCDTTACQVYRGYATLSADGTTTSRQPASTDDAVAATSHVIRSYGGNPAFTQFSSNDGGWTAAGSKPYLVARADPYSLSTGSPAGDAVGSWTASLAVSTVSAACPADGTAVALAPVARDGNGQWGGRISALQVTCTTGTVVLGAGATQLGLRSTWWEPDAVLSSGAVLAHWSALGGAAGVLGDPVTAEFATPGGTGSGEHFDGGSVYWSPATGAREVRGAIRADWAAHGWEASALGYPTTDELPTPDGRGRYSRFTGGSIYWTPATGAHEVQGLIAAHWAALGAQASALGYPTTDELPTPDGRARESRFTGGTIAWSPATGAHAVQGPLAAEWAAVGGESSALGLPTTDQRTTPDGRGRYTHFTGGSVYWSPATGAHEVQGLIAARWASLGWEASALGYPTSDEHAVAGVAGAPGARASSFQGGSVYWSAPTGAHAVLNGPLGAAWARAGGATGSLGLPTGEASAVPGQPGARQQAFAHGTVVVGANGVATVHLAVATHPAAVSASSAASGAPAAGAAVASSSQVGG